MAVRSNKFRNSMGVLSVCAVKLYYAGVKTFKRCVFIFLSALLLLGGCKDRNGDDYEELLKDPAFASSLTQWQFTIEDQLKALQGLISAFETSDYITEITPVLRGDVEIGYSIKFLKHASMTILYKIPSTNFAGHSPLISVHQNQSNFTFYWMLDHNWLLDNSGNRIPVTGSRGMIPRVVIGSDGYWYISPDAIATSAPPGTGWIETDVKAADAKGPKNNSLFTDIDISDPYFVRFILSDGTNFNIPKHIPVNVTYVNPGMFKPNESRKLVFNIDGILPGDNVDVIITDLPYNWKVSYDDPNKKNEITITAPSIFAPYDNEMNVIVMIGSRFEQMYSLNLLSNIYIGPAANEVGEIYYYEGDTVGVVYKKNNGTPGSGRVVSLDEGDNLNWPSSFWAIGAFDDFDGFNNTSIVSIYVLEEGTIFNWLYKKNETQLGRSYDMRYDLDVWYIPSKEELKELGVIMIGLEYEQYERTNYSIYPKSGFIMAAMSNFNAFNQRITNLGGKEISGNYWSSTEGSGYGNYDSWRVTIRSIGIDFFDDSKHEKKKARAVLAY